jgi:hypothetical protein
LPDSTRTQDTDLRRVFAVASPAVLLELVMVAGAYRFSVGALLRFDAKQGRVAVAGRGR